MTVGEVKDRFDYFWVFIPAYDSWRLARQTGSSTRIVVILDRGGLWIIMPTLSDKWEAVGIEQPKHPRSVIVPK